MWDTRGAKLLHSATLTNDTVFGASLAPDSSRVAVGCADNTRSRLRYREREGIVQNWESPKIGCSRRCLASIRSGLSPRAVIGRPRSSIRNPALSSRTSTCCEVSWPSRHPSKDVVVIGGEERYPYIYLMDRPRNMKIADDTTLVRKLERQEGAIFALDWSPDGKRIAVAGASPSVNLYDPETGDRKAACQGHSAGIYAVAFSPDATRLATGGFDGKVRVYNASDCKLLHEFVPVPLTSGRSTGH